MTSALLMALRTHGGIQHLGTDLIPRTTYQNLRP